MYSSADPSEIEIEDRFDLIWSGSFFTHIDEARWSRFLPFLASLLAPGGVLVFTTAGPATPAWVCSKVQSTPGLLLLGYSESRGGKLEHQDFVSCIFPAAIGNTAAGAEPIEPST